MANANRAHALSHQGLSTMQNAHTEENKTGKGPYVLCETDGDRDATLIATAPEVEIALNAVDILASEDVKTAVVSARCFELFEQQGAAYRLANLGHAPRVGVEALMKQGWGALLGDKYAFVGIADFGAFAPAGELFEKFGITPAATAQAARNLLAK
jgi:transketolase